MRSSPIRLHPIQALLLVLVPAAIFAASSGWLLRPALAQIAVRNQGYVPFSDAPINYRSNDLHDPVANLQKRLDAGETSLAFDDSQGYLKSASTTDSGAVAAVVGSGAYAQFGIDFDNESTGGSVLTATATNQTNDTSAFSNGVKILQLS